MSIVILVGGSCEQGSAEHRYVVGQFLDRFGDQVDRIITSQPTVRPLSVRIKRMLRRGHFAERLRRALYSGGYGPAADDIQRLLLPEESDALMPGAGKVSVVSSHNSDACRQLIQAENPQVLVVYGTSIIHAETFNLASKVTLNMHTGLSPFYRGDSTLFWAVYYNDPAHLGVTVHKLVESVDGGDIANTAVVDYTPGDSEAHLFAKAVIAGTELYLDAVERALEDTLVCSPQNLTLGREFSWRHRTVAAEKHVLAQLESWESSARENAADGLSDD